MQKAAPSARPLSVSAVSEALAGKRLPRLDFLIALAQTLLAIEDGCPVGRDDPRVKHWRARWQQLERSRSRVNARLLPPPRIRDDSDAVEPRSTKPDAPVVQEPDPLAGPGAAYRLKHLANVRRGVVLGVVFSPDSRLLATISDKAVQLWDPATGRPVGEPFPGHTGAYDVLVFSPDGRLLATASKDHTVRLWDPATGHAVREPLTVHTSALQTAVFSPDGRRLASTSDNGTVWLWKGMGDAPEDPAVLRRERDELAQRVTGLITAAELAQARIETLLSVLYERLPPTGLPLTSHTGPVLRVTFSPDSRLLATAGDDGVVQLWDPATGQPGDLLFVSSSRPLRAMAFSPDGHLMAITHGWPAVNLWEPGEPLGSLLTDHAVSALAFSPDGRLLATAGDDGTARLWNVTGAVSPPQRLSIE
ncbi:WD40 repeat domain-containing protein [Streptacidiphilus sp. N1-3]|uniref:WD40 repeat domain-containing protein n=1 Tax=Streptacidiphilus alkalitolerans TaxID=3342712 RepID=A0ABV6WZH2_9ACTN